MRGTWMRILGLLIFVFVLAGAGGWWMMRGQGGADLSPMAAPAIAAATTDAPALSPLPKIDRNRLVLPGVIEPYESVPVSAKLTANIASLMVRDGTAVAKSQLLCILDDTELRQQIDSARLIHLRALETLRRGRQDRGAERERESLSLATAGRELESYHTESELRVQQAEAALKRAQQECEDCEALHEAKAISMDEVREKQEGVEDAERALQQIKANTAAGMTARQQRLEQAQLDVRTESVSQQDIRAYELSLANAEAGLREREGQLADTRVVAPISGTVRVIPRTRTSAMMVTGKSAEVLGPGVRVYEGDPFLEIAATDRACVRVEVDETDVSRISTGVKATITGDAFPERKLEAEVAEIQLAGRRAGQGVSLFPITILITEPLEGVRMGMTADVTIQLEAEQKSTEGGQ